MKTLYIIRHAKSDWSDPTLEDFDRGLNKRGKKSIPLMGEALRDHDVKPDLIISSTAKRALLTAQGLAKELKYKKKIAEQGSLYLCEKEQWLETIASIDDKYDSVFIVGHNPEITDLVNSLIDDYIDNVPTLGIISFKLGVDQWTNFDPQKMKMEFFIYPKMFR